MPVSIHEQSAGDIVLVTVTGTMNREDAEHLAARLNELIHERGSLRLLLKLDRFHGWEAAAALEQLKLGLQHAADIDRIAIVGGEDWHTSLSTIGAIWPGLNVRCFDADDADVAGNWIKGG